MVPLPGIIVVQLHGVARHPDHCCSQETQEPCFIAADASSSSSNANVADDLQLVMALGLPEETDELEPFEVVWASFSRLANAASAITPHRHRQAAERCRPAVAVTQETVCVRQGERSWTSSRADARSVTASARKACNETMQYGSMRADFVT